MNIPDYISPVVAYRVWRWNETGLRSLNGEPWLPNCPIEARCRVAPAARHVRIAGSANEVPDHRCTCGVYAAKNIGHLRRLGYEGYGASGEVYLWGRVVEHTLGWRAQFAYPKSLVLPLNLLPFTLAELNVRLHALIAFGTDIFVLHKDEIVRLWKHAAGYDADGLDYIISLRQQHYFRKQQERTLKTDDRIALLGLGIAVVKQANDEDAVVVLGNGRVFRIARADIVFNQHNRRWEYRFLDSRAQAMRSTI